MPAYRLHYLDFDDRILAFEEIDARADDDALDIAYAKASWVYIGPWKLWRHDRCVFIHHTVDQARSLKRIGDEASASPEPAVRNSIWTGIEPSLIEALQDCTVRALMRADRVTPEDVMEACAGQPLWGSDSLIR
jgi:hypothetical protein